MYAQPRKSYQPSKPKWLDQRQIIAIDWLKLSPIKRQFLLDQGSLTQHLIQFSGNQFRVQRLKQYWGRAERDEAMLLSIKPRCRCLIREVLLHGGRESWVFARSVLPISSLDGDLYRLRKLKNSSLGDILFNQTSLQRLPFQLARIKPQHGYLPNYISGQMQPADYHWARRCRFEVKGKPILVSEVFLPNLMDRIR